MAKKVIISFLDIPNTAQPGWNYTIEVNSVRLTYNSGVDQCIIDFLPNGTPSTNINEIEVGLTIADTLAKVLAHLRANYVNSAITYEIVGNTIEMIINANAFVSSISYNDNIDILQFDINIVPYGLKYFIYFEDYYLTIKQKNYNGISTEIHGGITITKGSVDTILEPIRGTGLNLALEANPALTYDEFGLAEEDTYIVQLKKGSQIVFNGFIKPDGIQQNWVKDEWYVNIDCVDGLGQLNDLSFVKSNGLRFVGKMSWYDVIKGCLDRTGLLMTVNSSVEIGYNGYLGTNILKDTYINANRFFKKDNETLMNCNEVLTSVLNLFSGVITQHDGQWWIYRPNDLILNGYAKFVDNTLNTTFTKNLTKLVGSQIDNFYPHHCDGNQQIELKGAISAYRINYEYGFLDGFLENKNLVHDNVMNFDNWTELDMSTVVNDPLDNQGLQMYSREFPPPDPLNNFIDVLISGSFFVKAGTILKLSVKMEASRYMQFFPFKIKTSDGYFYTRALGAGQWIKKVDFPYPVDPWLITESGVSDSGDASSNNWEVTTTPVLNDCTIQVVICQSGATREHGKYRSLTQVNFVDIFDVTTESSGRVGEFHTVSRKTPPSSIVKENQTVFNGDSPFLLVGSIYKTDLTTTTSIWTRNGRHEEKPLLQISAEDDLRIQCNPIKIFTGNFFGFIPYLSVISINNVVGLFMFTQYSYDLKTKKVTGKLTQFYNNDLGDIQYLFSYDYGNNTIRPTITG